jgi:hypothetical protein
VRVWKLQEVVRVLVLRKTRNRQESAKEATVGVDNAAAGEVTGDDEIMLVAEGMVVESIDKLWHTEARK